MMGNPITQLKNIHTTVVAILFQKDKTETLMTSVYTKCANTIVRYNIAINVPVTIPTSPIKLTSSTDKTIFMAASI